jgi:hypothetical protein
VRSTLLAGKKDSDDVRRRCRSAQRAGRDQYSSRSVARSEGEIAVDADSRYITLVASFA